VPTVGQDRGMTTPAARVLVALDFSAEAERALEHAVALVRRHGGQLVLCHAASAVEPLELGLLPDGGALPAYQAMIAEELAAGRRRLEELAARLAGQVAVELALVEGFPDSALVGLASEHDVDLLVVGTHGRTGLGRALLGSVAEKVVRIAHRDVLVARGPAPTRGYRRILALTDFSPLADRALDRALELAADDAEIVLLHAWQLAGDHYLPGGTAEATVAPIRQAVEASARARGEAVVAARARPGLRFELVEGAASRAIEALAVERDLIAMGSHGRRGLRRLLLGSLAESTVRTAPCSVVVVHPPADAPRT
jgi:nucleotide-binding universal stress UspA family protein